jgi:hypothetical protein
MVSLMPQPLNLRGNSLWYLLDKRLDGEEKRKLLTPLEIKSKIPWSSTLFPSHYTE